MWKKCGNIWVCIKLPIITIEPVGKGMWQACCGGRPVPLIPTSYNLEYVMKCEKYAESRAECDKEIQRRALKRDVDYAIGDAMKRMPGKRGI